MCSAVLTATTTLVACWVPTVEAASSNGKPAAGAQRGAIVAAYKASDGNVAEIRGVFVSRSNSSLAVVCARTPEAGTRSYVFAHRGQKWRYLTSGPVGKVGGSTERALERSCG
jgi:phosphoglucomutase